MKRFRDGDAQSLPRIIVLLLKYGNCRFAQRIIELFDKAIQLAVDGSQQHRVGVKVTGRREDACRVLHDVPEGVTRRDNN